MIITIIIIVIIVLTIITIIMLTMIKQATYCLCVTLRLVEHLVKERQTASAACVTSIIVIDKDVLTQVLKRNL